MQIANAAATARKRVAHKRTTALVRRAGRNPAASIGALNAKIQSESEPKERVVRTRVRVIAEEGKERQEGSGCG